LGISVSRASAAAMRIIPHHVSATISQVGESVQFLKYY
jgi:hypothetical protein